MSDPLLQQIADRLGLSEQAAAEVLQDFVGELRRRLRDREAVEFGDLGTFRRRSGAPVFEPNPLLAEAVNHRFSGLESMTVDTRRYGEEESFSLPPDADNAGEAEPEVEVPELYVPRETSEWEPPREDDRTHPLGPLPPKPFEEAEFDVVPGRFGPADHLPPSDAPERPTETERVPETEHVPETERVPEMEPEAKAGPEPAPPAAGPGPADEPPVEEDESDAVPASVPASVPAAATSAPAPPRLDHSARRRSFEERHAASSRLPLLLLGLLAIAAVVFVALQFFGPTTPAEDPAGGAVVADTAAAAVQDTTSAHAAAGDTTAVEGTPTEPPPAAAYGLRGSEPIQANAGDWTLVVGSDTNRRRAQAAAETYRGQGFRTGVVHGPYRGVTRYRVAVGQFASLEAAEQARASLPSGFPDDAWALPLEGDFEVY